jgi:hypothetical protein
MIRPPSRSLLALLLLAPLACRTPSSGAPGTSEAARAADGIEVAPIVPVALYADPKLGLEVARGELTLPARFLRPDLRPAPGETGVAQLFLVRAELPEEEEETETGATEEGDGGEPLASTPPRPFVEPPSRWKVFALRRSGATDVALELRVEPGAAATRVDWKISAGAPGGRDDLQGWARSRLFAQDHFGAGDGPLQLPLLAAAIGAYGLDERLADQLDRSRRGDDQSTPSLLALLGGRAAVDETLQLDRGPRPSPISPTPSSAGSSGRPSGSPGCGSTRRAARWSSWPAPPCCAGTTCPATSRPSRP